MKTAILACIAFAGCVVPEWRGEEKVAARERAAVKQCGSGALTKVGAELITRDPYLQSTTTTSTVVAWGSREERGDVVLREPDGTAVMTAAATYAGDPDRKKARLEAQHRKEKELAPDEILVLKAELHDLQPTHLYCYQLLLDGKPLADPAPLTTAAAPDAAAPVHFVAVGDSGTGGAAELALARRIGAQPFDFLVFLGDIAYTDGTPAQLQTNFFAVYRDFLRYVPAYTTIGNHERRTRDGRPYFEAFVLPGAERYYSFDWGSVHLVAIDTTVRDDEELAWLDKDLERNRLPWVIVFGHHPLYTTGIRSADEWLREAYGAVVSRHHVDVVLSGHEHNYERFKVAGVNFIISGGGGGQLNRLYWNIGTERQEVVHHFLGFEVAADKLVMKAIDVSGKEIDKLELRKPVKDKQPKPQAQAQASP